MTAQSSKSISPLLVIIAFATVYLVWGSTYFFIAKAVAEIPPFLLGAIRFLVAGLLMAVWCLIKKENLLGVKNIWQIWITGFLLLFLGNGIVIWVEQFIPSAVVAITVSSSPLWFVLLDFPKWGENFRSRSILVGLLIGLIGVILLFSEQVGELLRGQENMETGAMLLLLFGSIAWAGGSLYSKYKSQAGSALVTSTWQMIAAGVAFLPGMMFQGELSGLQWEKISTAAWLSVAYLIIFGSIAAFSAYVWLLQVRPAVQVSTYAYVNPVVAVLLGIFFAGEKIGMIQIIGLIVILGSVLLINLAKYRREVKETRLRQISKKL